jgi:hypothetical protein
MCTGHMQIRLHLYNGLRHPQILNPGSVVGVLEPILYGYQRMVVFDSHCKDQEIEAQTNSGICSRPQGQ